MIQGHTKAYVLSLFPASYNNHYNNLLDSKVTYFVLMSLYFGKLALLETND